MGKISALVATALLAASAAFSAETFRLTFDDYGIKPQTAGGSPLPGHFKEPDLQLRMFPGVGGKGNSLNIANSESLTFPMQGNFDPRQGTVELWIAPQNWKVTDPGWQQFFHAAQPHFFLRIDKTRPYYITATLSHDSLPGKAKPTAAGAQARVNPEDWENGKWHQVVVTWNQEMLSLYIDGKEPMKTPLRIGKQTVAPTRPFVKLNSQTPLPAALPGGWFSVGMSPNWTARKEVLPENSTAIDSIAIFDRPLSAAEIRAAYEKVIPPVPKTVRDNLLTIPQNGRGITLDGKIDSTEWDEASGVLMRPVKSGPDIKGAARVRHDGNNLYIAFSSRTPCARKALTERDAPLWNDDNFEFHLLTPEKRYFQYIVNGNGALFDQQDGKPSWNGAARTAVHHTADGWTAELVIPLEELGGMKKLLGGKVQADFCASRHEGLHYLLYHWGSTKSFKPNDEVRFGTDGKFFRIDQVGDLTRGELSLECRSSEGLTTRTGVIPDGYPEIAYPENPASKPWKRRLPAGNLALEIAASSGKTPLYYYRRDFQVSYPLEISYNFKADKNEMEAILDFSNAGNDMIERIGKGIPAVVTFRSETGSVLTEKKIQIREVKSSIVLPLPAQLKPGSYSVQAEAGDVVQSVPFRMPDTAPYQLRLGDDHTIPPPWSAVESSGAGKYKVWGRTYEFSSDPFPRQIQHGKSDLLLSPPVWRLNGAPVRWNPPEVTEKQPDFIKFKGTGESGAVRFDWTGELWFDGAYILRLGMTAEKPAEIRDFSLRYAVPAEIGRFAMDPILTPWKNNRAEVALGRDSRRKDNILWLCGEEKGVMFWVKSDANWANRKGESPMVAERSKDRVEASINIISAPVKLSGRAEYTFVMMGTPSRPLPGNFRMVNYGGYLKNPYTTHQSVGWGQWNKTASDSDPSSANTPYPADKEKFRKFCELYRNANNAKLHFYSMPGNLCNVEPDFDYFGTSSRLIPGEPYAGEKSGMPWRTERFCTNATSLPADFWTYKLDRSLSEFKQLDGIYFDCASSRFCENRQHGCGGVDAFGKAYTSSDALGLRNFMMRVYKTVKKHNGSMMIHSHVQFIPFTHEFTDFFAPGENTFHLMVDNIEYGYCEGIPLEEYQSNFNYRRAGVAFCMLLQTGRAATLMPALKNRRKEIITNPEYAIRALTPFILHDVNIWDSYLSRETMAKYWGLRKSCGFDKISAFRGYWAEDCPVKSATPGLLCSVYEWKTPSPFSRIIAVGNFKRETLPVKLEIDFKSLGVPPPERYTDLWSGRELTPGELADLTLPGNHFLMLGISPAR